jgi:hypothetical protein
MNAGEDWRMIVIQPGSVVKLWGGVCAKVTAVLVGMDGELQYRVVYWNGNQFTEIWVVDDLIDKQEESLREAYKTPIGFKAINGVPRS